MDNFLSDSKQVPVFISAVLRAANIHILVSRLCHFKSGKILAKDDDYDRSRTASDFSWRGLPGRQ
jgi:hypothetical protein